MLPSSKLASNELAASMQTENEAVLQIQLAPKLKLILSLNAVSASLEGVGHILLSTEH